MCRVSGGCVEDKDAERIEWNDGGVQVSRFMDENGSGDYLQIAADDVVGFRVGVRPGAPPIVNLSSSDARAVAAEIIACADRIDPPKKPASDEVNPFCTPPSEGATLPTTPTHSSYESLATLAKAIAYLPSSLRDELNALLATRIREVLSVLK